MKSGNAHCYNCAVLKSGKGPRGEQFKKPYLGNYLEYKNKILHGPMNWFKVFMSKISSKSTI